MKNDELIINNNGQLGFQYSDHLFVSLEEMIKNNRKTIVVEGQIVNLHGFG
jgi:hypothetical protein